MDKLASYHNILKDHYLWATKEASEESYYDRLGLIDKLRLNLRVNNESNTGAYARHTGTVLDKLNNLGRKDKLTNAVNRRLGGGEEIYRPEEGTSPLYNLLNDHKDAREFYAKKMLSKEAEDPSMLDEYRSRLKKDRGQAGAAVGALARRVIGAMPGLEGTRALPVSSLTAYAGDRSVGDAATAFGAGTAGRITGSIGDLIVRSILPGSGRKIYDDLLDRDLGPGSLAGELAIQDLAFSNRRKKKQMARDAKAYRKSKAR